MNKLSKSESGKLGALALQKNALYRRQVDIDNYNIDPALCKCCQGVLIYDKRNNKFCGKSCSTTFNNLLRKQNVTWNCLFCGTEHTSKPYRVKDFCNLKCNTSYKAANLLNDWLSTGNIDRVNGAPGWLKRYILEKQNNKCAECGIFEWNSKPIVFDLEHIDGDSSNNQEDNLCCLCPNCHSQTATYKNRNKGNGRHSRRERYAAGKSF